MNTGGAVMLSTTLKTKKPAKNNECLLRACKAVGGGVEPPRGS